MYRNNNCSISIHNKYIKNTKIRPVLLFFVIPIDTQFNTIQIEVTLEKTLL